MGKLQGDPSGSNTLAAAVAADTTTGGFIKDSQAGSLPATATNDNATAGTVGEVIESTVAVASAVSLVTDTAKTVTSISLTAGDWDVWGNIGFTAGASTTMSLVLGTIHTTTDALPTAPGAGAMTSFALAFTTGVGPRISAGQRRISIASTTTVYLIAYATFGVSTLTAYGYIGARRAR